jgi:hypothetical protein
MIARFAIAAVTLLAALPSMAEPMNPEAARRFVVGKLFAFNCFDGSRGSGRIYGDGSVIGTVQFAGSGPVRNLWLPAGTLRTKGQAVCATVKGLLFEPCFNLDKTTNDSFRGAVSGMTFAYCDFTRRNANVAGLSLRSRAPQPLSLNAPVRAEGE